MLANAFNTPRLGQALRQTRRHFLGSGLALGRMYMAGEKALAGPIAPARPARAKAGIYLHMSGSPPQQDLFDYKPYLKKHHLQPCPDSMLAGERFAFIKGHPTLLGSPFDFAPRGQSGQMISSVMPHLHTVADKLTVIRSMTTKEFNHAPAELFVHTGDNRPGYPSMGAWASYGLGSANRNLPGFMVLVSGGTDPTAGKSVWGSGFLPSVHQGVQCRSGPEPIFYVSDPPGMDRAMRRQGLDALNRLNTMELARGNDPETRTRIEQYELAYRMQASVPEVMDISREPATILREYGATVGQGGFAANCLLARRMVEQGVRYVQLFDWGWDTHGTGPGDDIVNHLPKKCKEVDQPIAALLRDLDRRGMLDSTLVVWGGEFGRTSMNEARGGSKSLGRDHHPHCFTLWMAGGGIKPGLSYGATDELGWRVAENPVDVHDMQATVLHLLGLDPFTFSYPTQGLNARLIGPAEGPRVLKGILA
ncbi:MAG: DUF1501 domain-containing protein [Planctomycetota bacterium]|nr:DUF1501 domain-containing protein [Planctomycetota bacterium]